MLSFFVRILWPCAIAIVALRIISFPLPRGWNPGLVPAPGVSALDAIIFLWAGYYGSQRTGRLATGILTAGVTSVIGFTIFFTYAALTNPRLLLAPFEQPFIFVIIAVLLSIALGFRHRRRSGRCSCWAEAFTSCTDRRSILTAP